jgi:hypothetical protein
MVAQDGPVRVEWLLVGNACYSKRNAGSWSKLTDPREIALGRMTFPGALVPQELRFSFQPGDLKS